MQVCNFRGCMAIPEPLLEFVVGKVHRGAAYIALL